MTAMHYSFFRNVEISELYSKINISERKVRVIQTQIEIDQLIVSSSKFARKNC